MSQIVHLLSLTVVPTTDEAGYRTAIARQENSDRMQYMAFKHTITINADFGSAMQRDVAMRVIREVLEEWKATVLAGHQRNKLTVTYDEESFTN